MKKKCFKCLITKSKEDFYKHSGTKDGYLNKCKECAKKDSNEHRDNNISKVREYDRNRPNHEERIQKNKEHLENDPIAKKRNSDKRNEWAKNNKHKRNANLKVARAIMNGTIKREYNCSKCDSDIKIEAHHEDYTKPLEVIWLCCKCHHKRHKEIRANIRSLI